MERNVSNFIRIRGDFLNEQEANAAVEKIGAYCHNIRIVYNSTPRTGYDHDGADGYGSFAEVEPGFYGYDVMSGINTGWSLSPYGAYNFEHSRRYNLLSSLGLGRNAGKTIVEAEVAQDKYEFVKERLYSLGATSVG